MTSWEWIAAWRAIRARGGSAVLAIGLITLAIASNAVMFAFADSLVFNNNPFPDADRVFTLSSRTSEREPIDLAASARLLREWQGQTDLVAAAGTYYQKDVFLHDDDGPLEQVRTADVTIGLFDVLGVSPRWGRGFAAGDDIDPTVFAVVISEELATRRFGSAAAAVGQTLQATSGKHAVIGVMDSGFVFPNATFQMWRALDHVGPLTRNFGGASPVVRVAVAIPIDAAATLLTERSSQVGAGAGLSTYTVQASPYFRSAPTERRTMVLILFGAALSLLLAVCANVASLELAGTVARARIAAVQLALGASRGAIARGAALEGLMLVACAFILAMFLTWWVTGALAANLPDVLRLRTSNRLDIDGRAIAAMVGFATMAWIVGALPRVFAASRTDLHLVLKAGDRGASASRRSVWWRQALTLSQVTFAVILMIGTLLFVRSYRNLLAVERGFDSKNLYSISWTLPATYPLAPLRDRVLEQLRIIPGVEAVTTSAPPPSKGDSPSELAIEVSGQGLTAASYVGRKWVDANFFSVVGLPVKQGRVFGPDSGATDVVLPESFARRYFPAGDAVGRTFRRSSREPWLTVIGVVGDFRSERTRMPSPEDREVFHYALMLPPAPRPLMTEQPPGPALVDTGGSLRVFSLTAKLGSRLSPQALLSHARAIEPGVPVTVVSVDERYERQAADTRLSTQIVGVFGVLAFGIAVTGVVGVLAFLVSSRTREIGIRVALGADRRSVQRLVVKSSLGMVVPGILIGFALAVAGTQALEAQLFGITPTTGWPYGVTALAVLGAATGAAWLPARRAARVDPAVTLRHD
jgi:putative ABC transport system permease protein